MALRQSRPFTFRPRGLSDTLDGSNAFPGAMASLQNLIPAPSTKAAFVPRSASLQLTDFTDLDAATKGVPNALLVVGSIAYGMIPETSGAYNGKDVPFAYNYATDTFLTVAIPGGAASLPTSPAATGEWTPPIMAQVGNHIVITHPGYAGGAGPYFGWLDLSSFSSVGITGDSFSSATITGNTHTNKTVDTLSANAIAAGWYVGMTITDAASDIPANTTITSIAADGLSVQISNNATGANATTTLTVTKGPRIVNLSADALTLGWQVGMKIAGGSNVPADTTIVSIDADGLEVTLSKSLTGTLSSQALTVTGGTAAAPLYGSGNTNGNPLSAVPVAVAQFNGRAWYAVGTGVVFSDSLVALQVTNASQALTFQNGLAVTALAGLPLSSPVTGGMIQSLIAFQGDNAMAQITGDSATMNLAVNFLNVASGTLAPLTIAPTPQGLAFVAPDGLRIVNFGAQVSDPIGINGDGVCVPFQNAKYASRMCAAYHQNTLRISVQNSAAAGEPTQEYWYDFTQKIWSGPHSFPAALIQPLQDTTNGFLLAGSGIAAALWTSSTIPALDDTFTENGAPLVWIYQTSLMPDNDQMAENSMIETTLALDLSISNLITIQPLNEKGVPLDTVTLMGSTTSQSLWGTMVWGQDVWLGGDMAFEQFALNWHNPIVFKQMSMRITAESVQGFAIGNLYMKYEILGYKIARSGTA